MVKQIAFNTDCLEMESPINSVQFGRPQPLASSLQATTSTAATIIQTPSIGRAVSCALLRAVYEKRVVVGVAAAVKELLSNATASSRTPAGDVMFCVLAPATAGDSASHMSTTLLEAFCYENGIYMVKVDSARKLTRLLGSRQMEMCALVQRPWRELEEQFEDDSGGGGPMTVAEETMADYCEEYWDLKQPVVHLPD